MKTLNKVGKYAASEEVDELQLLQMVIELTEKDKMVMWSEGYLDLVIEKLPEYARDILENRKGNGKTPSPIIMISWKK